MRRDEIRIFDALAHARRFKPTVSPFGTCDFPGCQKDSTEEDLKTGVETCALHHGWTGYRPIQPDDVVRVGIDYGHGPDRTYVTEFTRNPDGSLHVHSVSECGGEDCGNQYTGGQDF